MNAPSSSLLTNLDDCSGFNIENSTSSLEHSRRNVSIHHEANTMGFGLSTGSQPIGSSGVLQFGESNGKFESSSASSLYGLF